ncbi:MAG: InlB B-repeat-containing protein, partial [Clostridia bacterium]|nr:InlB B-repeat-containing protein [Clostridia bacterium]
PTATKAGYTFGGWYTSSDFSGSAITEIGASDLGNKTFYAKWNLGMANYNVKVLVAQYDSKSVSGYYFPNNLTYVDRTAEFASLLGLDENNQGQGETGSVIDLTSLIAGLRGAKLNAGSIVSGTISADGSLELIVKLDVDEEALGFKLSDVSTGQYGWTNTLFTLSYVDGVCGLLVSGVTNNVKEIAINLDSVNVSDYAVYSLVIYDKGYTKGNKWLVNDLVENWNPEVDQAKKYATTDNSEYVKYSLNVISEFSNEKVINKIRLVMAQKDVEHTVFIKGIEKAAWKKETVTYSIANGNLVGISTPIAGSLATVDNYDFATGAQPALHYSYEGEAITADHQAGVIFDLGAIKVSDYKTIKINLKVSTTYVYYIDGAYVGYGGANNTTIDIKAIAESKNITAFSKFEVGYGRNSTIPADMYVASIELELMPEVLCDACGSTEVAHSACEFCGELTCVGDHSECKPVLCEACGSKEVAHGACEFCGTLTCVGDHSKCQNYTVTLVANGGSVEGSLTEYAYGTGATLPTASKLGYAFAGWF